jgi:glycosyltransferase involved in cell wall biosynthesis
MMTDDAMADGMPVPVAGVGPRRRALISIVTPCFNEELNVVECYEAVRRIFEAELPAYDHEHIFCDNASTDRTLDLLRGLAARDRRVKVIANARNFGPFHSNFNGILSTRGDAVLLLLAADLQDPPELIPQFVRLWEQGYEVVYGVRRWREEGRIMRTIRRAYYRLVAETANIEVHQGAGEFQLTDRKVVDALHRFDDYYPYIRGMVAYCGFRAVGVDYTWKARKRGVTKNNLIRLIDQGLNGLISFTNVPMRLCMAVGLFIATLSFSWGLISFIFNLLYYRKLAPPGIPTLIVALFVFSGIQLFTFGVMGEYLAAIHAQVRKRPLVVERERINFDEPAGAGDSPGRSPSPSPSPVSEPGPMEPRRWPS